MSNLETWRALLSERNADEVVTKALVRDVELPCGAGTMALITLDNGFDHTKPNTFGPHGLLALNGALDEIAARTDLAAVGVTGKPFIFAVGADLKGAATLATREEALAIGAAGPRRVPPPGRAGRPVVRVRQRRGHGRRPGDRAALHLPDDLRPASRRWRCPSASSAWCRAGAARSCCPA